MKSRNGFTLIELLIVVAIIGILAAIAIPNFMNAQVRAKVSRCQAEMQSTATALESYRIDNSDYPPESEYPNGWTPALVHVRVPSYLTTPVSHMKKITHDPFIEQKNLTSINKRYVYYNTIPHIAWYGDDVWNGLYAWVGAWVLYGQGPDREWMQGTASTLLPYDPTNGTTSVGNIIRCQKRADGIPLHPVTGTYYWQ